MLLIAKAAIGSGVRAALVIGICLVAVPAAAQPEQGDARTHFVRGQTAIEAGRWTDALNEFQWAYDLSQAPTAMFNVAFALRALGRHIEARDTFDRLLRAHPDAAADLLAEAGALRAEVSGLVVVFSLTGLHPATPHAVRLDGAPVVDEGGRPMEVESDPGTRTLRVSLDGHRPFEWAGRVSGGDRMPLEVTLEAMPEPSLLENPFLWIAAGLVVVAGGVTAGVLVYQSQQPPETRTNRQVGL